jgi:hypothetical protein
VHPLAEGDGEGARIDAIKDPFEGVVTGNPVSEREEALQPVAALPGERSE